MSNEMKATGFEKDQEGNWQWMGWLEAQSETDIEDLLEKARKKSEEQPNYSAYFIDLNNLEGM